jgi:hypothetical protein
MSLTTPALFSEVADSVTCNGYGDCVSLLRERMRYVVSPVMGRQTGKSLAWLRTELALRHIRDCLAMQERH